MNVARAGSQGPFACIGLKKNGRKVTQNKNGTNQPEMMQGFKTPIENFDQNTPNLANSANFDQEIPISYLSFLNMVCFQVLAC